MPTTIDRLLSKADDALREANERQPELLERLSRFVNKGMWREKQPDSNGINATSTTCSEAYLTVDSYK